MKPLRAEIKGTMELGWILSLVRFFSLILTALLAGMLFYHVLELPNKMKLPANTRLAVQRLLYNEFGPVASVIEPLAIVLTLLLAVLVRERRSILALTASAAVCEIAHPAEWFAVVNPVNLRINSWMPSKLPANWTQARSRWSMGTRPA
jgi:hypothetical protein